MFSIETEAILLPIINFNIDPNSNSKKMANDQNIPILTDLVIAGNPKLKVPDKDKQSKSPQAANLNMRIDEIEVAIGQDKSGPIGRAFAIRAEKKSENPN